MCDLCAYIKLFKIYLEIPIDFVSYNQSWIYKFGAPRQYICCSPKKIFWQKKTSQLQKLVLIYISVSSLASKKRTSPLPKSQLKFAVPPNGARHEALLFYLAPLSNYPSDYSLMNLYTIKYLDFQSGKPFLYLHKNMVTDVLKPIIRHLKVLKIQYFFQCSSRI